MFVPGDIYKLVDESSGLHHGHKHHNHNDNDNDKDKIIEDIDIALFNWELLEKRGTSTSTSTSTSTGSEPTCSPNDSSPQCQKPTSDESLPIALGVAIPLGLAIIVLIYLHFRHLKKLKKEEEETKNIDIDMDDYDPQEAGVMYAHNNNDAGVGIHDNPHINEKAYAFDHRSIQGSRRGSTESHDPFYANTPYLAHPDLMGSKLSLDEYSKSLHHSLYNNQAYPSNASVYSSNGISKLVPGSAYDKSTIQYPPPIRTRDTHRSSVSSNSSSSFQSSTRARTNVNPTSPLAGINESIHDFEPTRASPFDDRLKNDQEREEAYHEHEH